MDNGLILLNTIESLAHIKYEWYFAGKPISWIAIIGTTILVIIGVLSFIYSDYDDEIIVFGIICILVAIGVVIGTFIHEETKPYPLYKVTITETTNMKEFYEKYEIINQEGLIFTIRDKDYKERNYE